MTTDPEWVLSTLEGSPKSTEQHAHRLKGSVEGIEDQTRDLQRDDPENRLTQVNKPDPPTQNLNNFSAFTTGGDSGGWTTEGGSWCYHNWDQATGTTCDDGTDWMQTTVTGAGTLKFWWKVSSEGTCDYLEFYIDGQQQDAISGEVGWTEKTFTISGTGTHTLKWQYAKSSTGTAGQDRGWVDWVQWNGTMTEPATTAWSTLNYVYDASGRRIEKQYDGRTVLKYLYDGDHCIAEYGAGNDLHRQYVYGPGVDQPICLIEAAGSYAGTYYYHFDGSGNVVALTSGKVNDMGDTVQVYDYSVYGQVGATDASHPNRIMFTGREFDKETGLYYYRARYYKPEIGRFLQVDPVGYEAGMNLYRYCSNNPWNATDPYGRDDSGDVTVPDKYWPKDAQGNPILPEKDPSVTGSNWNMADCNVVARAMWTDRVVNPINALKWSILADVSLLVIPAVGCVLAFWGGPAAILICEAVVAVAWATANAFLFGEQFKEWLEETRKITKWNAYCECRAQDNPNFSDLEKYPKTRDECLKEVYGDPTE